ncbi:MAG: ABC transporter permease [Candidatus Rokubacteria bacterium]|nr:ABC transporter permease [Candidatus Rokubacteria bacterium]
MGELLAVLAGALRISTPYTLAALGGTLSERSGVINIALEAGLLMGALAYAVAAHASGNPWLGLLAAMAAGVTVMSLHAALCLHARANHIIVAVGLNLLAVGTGRFALKALYNSAANGPRVDGFETTWWHAVQELPVAGTVGGTPLVLVGIMLVPVIAFLVDRTVLGLRIRAVGQHPAAAETQGVGVLRVRWAALLLCGLLCGLGGAYLAADQHQFTQGMSAGRGFIAVSAVVFGQWRPARVWVGCLLFGLLESLQISLQSSSVGIPGQLVQMLPYAMTLVVLAVTASRANAPRALGQPWPPER